MILARTPVISEKSQLAYLYAHLFLFHLKFDITCKNKKKKLFHILGTRLECDEANWLTYPKE